MRKIFLFSFLILLAYSCRKESSTVIWEKSFDKGNALFVSSSPDSGILVCGDINGKPYLAKLSKNRSITAEYSSGRTGIFNAAFYDTSGYTACGSSNGEMLLARISRNGARVWDTLIAAGFNIDFTRLCYSGSGSFLAIGTPNPDSSDYSKAGLLFVRFDTTGQVMLMKEEDEADFIAAGSALQASSGDIFIALTRRSAGADALASVAMYNSGFVRTWETELYNNPEISSSSHALAADNSGNIYVAGKTQATGSSGQLDYSFAASVNSSGNILWKKYLEDSNSGSALLISDKDVLMVLDRNCFLVDLITNYNSADNVTVEGLVRMYSVCDSYNTDAFASAFDLYYDGNILAAGSMGGNFYLALKSASQ